MTGQYPMRRFSLTERRPFPYRLAPSGPNVGLTVQDRITLPFAIFKHREYDCERLIHLAIRRRFAPYELAFLLILISPAWLVYNVVWLALNSAFPHKASPPDIPMRRFVWTQYYIYRTLYTIITLPLLVRVRWLKQDIFPKTTVPRTFGPFSLSPEPGFTDLVAHMAWTWEGEATAAETTLTADPGTAGTSLAVTTRSPFPQQTYKLFWLLVQNGENDKTNREYMRVTAGQGAGAGSFTVVRAQEGTAGVAHPIGSYVALTLTATGEKNKRLMATGMIHVKDQFLALGDGSTIDTTAIQNAINSTDSVPDFAKGGVILFSAGTYRIDATLTCPQNVHNGIYKAISFRGPGMENMDIRRASGFQGIMLDCSGTITAGNVVTRQSYITMKGMTFHGFNGADQGVGAPIIRCYYTMTSMWERVEFNSNNGPAIAGVEFQDSRIRDCYMNYCNGTVASNTAGTAVGTETVRILSRGDNAVSGTFGYSTDNSNNLWFTDNLMTSGNASQAGVIVISAQGSTNPHRIYFTNNKIEGNPYTSNPVKLWNVRWCRFTNSDFSGYSYNGSSSITWLDATGAEGIAIRNCVFDDANTANMTHTAMKVTNCTYWTVEDVIAQFGTALAGDTNASVFFDFTGGGNDQIYLNNYSTSQGTRTTPQFSGTLPTNFFTTVRTLVLRKTADQLLAGITAQNVTDLSYTVTANTDWFIQATIFVNNTASDTGGVKIAISTPTGATIKLMTFGPTTGVTAFNSALVTASATLTTAFDTVATTPSWIQIQGTIRIGSTAGTIQIQAAEGTATDDITIQANSNLWAQKA